MQHTIVDDNFFSLPVLIQQWLLGIIFGHVHITLKIETI